MVRSTAPRLPPNHRSIYADRSFLDGSRIHQTGPNRVTAPPCSELLGRKSTRGMKPGSTGRSAVWKKKKWSLTSFPRNVFSPDRLFWNEQAKGCFVYSLRLLLSSVSKSTCIPLQLHVQGTGRDGRDGRAWVSAPFHVTQASPKAIRFFFPERTGQERGQYRQPSG
ncbi:hypothetical protein AWENTII_013021 [Aspergillus wentii]